MGSSYRIARLAHSLRDTGSVEDRGGTIIPVAAVFTLLSTCMVILRLYTRLAIVRSPGWEDWILLAASVCSIIMAGLLVHQVNQGLGKHTYDLAAAEVSTISKYYWIESIFYTLALGLTKISIVVQYLRIFAAAPATRIACICALCFLVIALTQAFFLAVFICTPVSKFWTSQDLRSCMDLTRLYVAQSSLNICSDLLVILLPVPAISSLKMSGKERYALIGIFALGSFGCITTVVRLIYVIRNSDSRDATWNNIEPITWSALEVFVAITCASLPALRKALQRMFPRFLQSTGYPSTTRPSGQGAHLPFTDNLSTAGRKSIRLDALRTSQKDGEIVAAARSISKDDAGTWSDQQLENAEAQSLSESERNVFS